MARTLLLLSDELDRAGLLFASRFELLPVSAHYRHPTEMVQEASIDNSTRADSKVAKVRQALASPRADLCMVDSARSACDTCSASTTMSAARQRRGNLRIHRM